MLLSEEEVVVVSVMLLLLSLVVEEAVLRSIDSVARDGVSVFAASEDELSEGSEPPGVDRIGRVWEDGKAELSELADC